MLHLHTGNRLERLLDRLSRTVSEPLRDPVVPEQIVVQNPGMARWIAQQLAERLGIAANLSFPLPASFFWSVLELWFPNLPEAAELDREALTWRLMAELPRHLDEPGFEPVARYLSGEPGEIKRLQLCERIAGLYDQYLVYRPDWILDWESGSESYWQAVLWRALAESAEGQHRAALLLRLSDALSSGQPPVSDLPERVGLFGLTALAPAYLGVLEGLARYTQVHLFLMNPCREYWADLVSERDKTRRRARAFRVREPDTSALLDVGNPLLASMGHAGQEFVDLLLELGPQEHEAFEGPGDRSLLACVQSDILDLRDRRSRDPGMRTPMRVGDRSLQLNSCHSPMREVQVLHDRLLRLFDEIPGLEPRQIVVMAPDIDRYAAYVDAVFGAAGEEHRIPWSVSDRRLGEEQPLLAAVAGLLRLPSGRFTASEVMALLELSAVQRRFGLEQNALERLRSWVKESGIRWGLDGGTRAGLGLPAEDANSWAFGLRRLFLGYALPPDTPLYRGVSPYPDLEGSDAVHLGTLQEIVRRLECWRRELAGALPAAQWPGRINRLLRDFFVADPDQEQDLQLLRDAVEGLSRQARAAGMTEALGTELVAAWVDNALAQPGAPNRFLTGRVTFCNMVPMRSIPFRVVCLLGLNDTDFPRNQRPLGFDLMADDYRRGDRSRRRDDRYLFLEALLSARDGLYLSWVGRDIRDNSPRVPSVLVNELLDYLVLGFRDEEGADLKERLLSEHPLQPFSPRYFRPSEPKLFSYARDWLAAAAAKRTTEIPPFADCALPEPERPDAELSLDELVRFFGNPAAAFLGQRLAIRLVGDAEVLDDRESFDPDGLESYGLRGDMLELVLRGEGLDPARRLLRAQGRLPHGAVGDLIVQKQFEAASTFAARLRPRLPVSSGEPGPAVEIDLPVGPYRLRGWLPQPVRGELVGYRFGRLRAKDRLGAWIRHLVWCLQENEDPPQSTFLADDYSSHLDPVEDPGERLRELIDAYRQGLQGPLCFFPETSLAWAETEEFTQKVWTQWNGEYNAFADSRDRAVAIAWRGRDPLRSAEFAERARRIWAPMLQVSDLVKADDDLAALETEATPNRV